jgi:mono/diheme cytochrome c family protein
LKPAAALLTLALVASAAAQQPPTFYRDVLPILQQHCQSCHRPGEIGPMPLVTYAQVRPFAHKIVARTAARDMPPWFADPAIGHWANDPSLSPAELRTLAAWAAAAAPAGDPRQSPPAPHWATGWNISPPDSVFTLPQPVAIPAQGTIEYTYEIVPTGFTTGRWVQMAELRPSSPAHVHHAVVYVRPPGSTWLRGAPVGKPFTASEMVGHPATSAALWTDSEILLVYAPGSAPDRWPATMGKYIPAGSDLVFQMHYTANGHPARDQTRLGLVFNSQPPAQRVLTLQLTNDHFVIPPGVPHYRVEVHGTLPGDATLLSFFPHMHLRGKEFEYNLVAPNGAVTPLLRVRYNFHWQRSYVLATPLPLKAGAELQAVGWYDNSAGNPHNPDPTVAVHWGDQTSDEMMVGFFDLAVPASLDKWQYFAQRHPQRR